MKFAYLIEPPFNYRTSDGMVTGCDVELVKAIAKAIGDDDLQLIETEFAELLQGVSDGSLKYVCSYVMITTLVLGVLVNVL